MGEDTYKQQQCQCQVALKEGHSNLPEPEPVTSFGGHPRKDHKLAASWAGKIHTHWSKNLAALHWMPGSVNEPAANE